MIRPSRKFYIKCDKRLSFALVAPFVILIMQYLVLAQFDLLGGDSGAKVKVISKLAVAIIYVVTFRAVWKLSKFKLIMAYLLSVCLFVLNLLIFPENQNYLLAVAFPFFCISLPSFFYSYNINDWGVFDKYTETASVIVFFIGSTLSLLVIGGKLFIGDYSMSLSYYMLLPALIFLDKLFNKITIEALVVVVFSFLVIAALGSRGALMCIAVFFIVKLHRVNKFKSYKSIIISMWCGLMLVAILCFYENILAWLCSCFLSLGIKSRSLSIFMSKQLHLSGREVLYREMVSQIQNNPILGVGLAGDRRILGTYSHNIGIEILSGFGVIFGFVIIALLVFAIIKGIFSSDEKEFNTLFLWFVMGVVPLVVSGSYLTSISFWIFMGLVSKKWNS